MSQSNSQALPNLDLLRSFAVSLVVVQHIFLALHITQVGSWDIRNLGIIGVFMFFVHTSLVLMWSLARRPDALEFYIRRAFRIYPVAMAAVLCTVAFHIPSKHNAAGDIFYYAPSWQNLVANLLLIQNLVWHGNILGVLWTLPLEVDMYLLLPFLFSISVGKSALWQIGLIWVGIVLADWHFLAADDNSFAACIPYFLAGVISSTLFARIKARLPGALLPAFLVLLVALYMARPSLRNGWWLTMALGVSLPLFRPITARWLAIASHHVAKYSYGIYLIHSFCLVIGLFVLTHFGWIAGCTAFLVSLALIVVPTYHWLEKPMIDLGARIANRLGQPQEIKAERESA